MSEKKFSDCSQLSVHGKLCTRLGRQNFRLGVMSAGSRDGQNGQVKSSVHQIVRMFPDMVIVRDYSGILLTGGSLSESNVTK